MANILFVYERKMPTTEGIHEIFNSEEAKEYGICAQFVTVWRVNQELRNSFCKNIRLTFPVDIEKGKG